MDVCIIYLQQEADLGFLNKIIELHEGLAHLKSPLGSQESPARSCLDILLEDPDASDGK